MNKKIDNELKQVLVLLKEALRIYVKEGQERIIEQEKYEMYKQQYPYDEYYYFEEEFKCNWE